MEELPHLVKHKCKTYEAVLRFSSLKFLKHCSVVGNVLTKDEYGPLYLTHLPSTSIHNLVDVYRKPWFIYPIQTGTVLNPSDSDMCKLHRQYIHLPLPEEDFCSQLPFSLLGNRRWNLPDKHGFLIRSKRLRGYDDKEIEGTAGYWSVNGVSEVADEDGSLIGMKTCYNLVFGDKCHVSGGRTVAGKWSAEEFTCFNKEVDGDCCLVALYCENDKLKSLELTHSLREYDFATLIHKNLNKNTVGEGVQLYLDDVMGTCIRWVDEERRASREEEERQARWVLGSKVEPDLDAQESEMYKSLFARDSERKLRGGARVQVRRKRKRT